MKETFFSFKSLFHYLFSPENNDFSHADNVAFEVNHFINNLRVRPCEVREAQNPVQEKNDEGHHVRGIAAVCAG